MARKYRSRRRRAGERKITVKIGKSLGYIGSMGYILLAVTIGVGLGSRFLAPRDNEAKEAGGVPSAASGSATSTPSQGLISALQEDDPSTGAESQSVVLPELRVYAVAAGPYEKLEDAGVVSERLMRRGAAGYVREGEGGYFVLLSAYAQEDAAATVASRLDGEDDMAISTLPLEAQGLTLNISSSAERISRIQYSYAAFMDTVAGLGEAWRDLDGGKISATDAAAKVNSLQFKLDDARNAAFGGALIEGDTSALSGWNDALQVCSGYLQTISSQEQSPLSISAKIKYTYIACVSQYMKYLEGLEA